MSVTLHGPDGRGYPDEHRLMSAQAHAAPQSPPPPPPATASERVIAAANALDFVIDARGRRLGWRHLNALEEFDLVELAGRNWDNAEWRLRAVVAAVVREIDGERVMLPTNRVQLRATIQRLGTEGRDAVVQRLIEMQPAPEDEGATGSEARDAFVDRAKN